MIHDVQQPDRTPLLASQHRDSLDPASRRVNQSSEVLIRHPIMATASDTGIINGQYSIWEISFTNILNPGSAGALFEVCFFLNDATATANILYPRHSASTVDMSQWQVLGPTGSLIRSGLTTQNDNNVYTENITFRNISAGTVNIVAQLRTRYIINRG